MFRIIFLVTLIIAALEDKKSLEIRNRTMAILFLIVGTYAIFYGVELSYKCILLLIGIFLIFLMGVIGEGDTKVFLLSAIILDPENVALAMMISLMSILFVSKENRRNTPLLVIYVPMLVLLELLKYLA